MKSHCTITNRWITACKQQKMTKSNASAVENG